MQMLQAVEPLFISGDRKLSLPLRGDLHPSGLSILNMTPTIYLRDASSEALIEVDDLTANPTSGVPTACTTRTIRKGKTSSAKTGICLVQ